MCSERSCKRGEKWPNRAWTVNGSKSGLCLVIGMMKKSNNHRPSGNFVSKSRNGLESLCLEISKYIYISRFRDEPHSEGQKAWPNQATTRPQNHYPPIETKQKP